MSHAPLHSTGPANAAADWWISEGLVPAEGHQVAPLPFTHEGGRVDRQKSGEQPGGYVDTWPEARLALADLTYYVRPFDKWSAELLSGHHGAVIERRTTAHDGQPSEPWDIDRTTARNAPVVGWDAGTTIGAPDALGLVV